MRGEHPSAGGGHEDPESRARQICLRQLALAPRTRAQLREALIRRDVPEDVADTVLGRFADVGLIDDTAFAKAWVESRHYSRGLAGRALEAELRRRGVDGGDIKEAVSALGPDAEVETARRLVERRLAGTRGQPAAVRVRRLAGMLARKGYPAALAFRVIREALEAEAAAEEAETGEAEIEEAATGAAEDAAEDMEGTEGTEGTAAGAGLEETLAFLGDEPPPDPFD